MGVKAGIVVMNSKGLVYGGIPTGYGKHEYADIFKGSVEGGERPEEAAVRELEEESGILADPDDLDILGVYPFVQGGVEHTLYLFGYHRDVDVKDLYCVSLIDNPGSRNNGKPEMESFVELPLDSGRWLRNIGKVFDRVDWGDWDVYNEFAAGGVGEGGGDEVPLEGRAAERAALLKRLRTPIPE